MRLRVASEGCSVRLKGFVQLGTFCRGRNGRVQRFKRFNKTEKSILYSRKARTETGDHEKFEPRHSRVSDLWSKEIQECCARCACFEVRRLKCRLLISVVRCSHRLCCSVGYSLLLQRLSNRRVSLDAIDLNQSVGLDSGDTSNLIDRIAV